MARIFRLFKLFRYFSSLQVLARTVGRSIGALMSLIAYISIAVRKRVSLLPGGEAPAHSSLLLPRSS